MPTNNAQLPYRVYNQAIIKTNIPARYGEEWTNCMHLLKFWTPFYANI